jgi:glycosyltransferase involved in cell wall biosynthesis
MICPDISLRGGAEVFSYELAKSIANNIKVIVATFSSNCYPKQLNLSKNLTILPILKKGKMSLFVNVFRIFKLLINERFDVVHAHFVFPMAFWGLAAKVFGIPLIVTSHGWDIQKDRNIRYGARLNKKLAILIWLTLKFVDVHVVVSKYMIKDAIEAGSNPSKLRVIYNGIDLTNTSSPIKTDILDRHGIAKEDFVVLYLGRLHPKKRPEDVVKAFAIIAQKIPNAKLVIAGKGTEERKLKKLAAELNIESRVIFTGFVSDYEKWDLLKRCDVFVLPSIIEGFAITLIEAMACGKPVIATNVGPFPEIIKNGKAGMLVPPCSPNHLADALMNLAWDYEKRAKIGKEAREYVKDRFEINKVASEYLKIYEDVIR